MFKSKLNDNYNKSWLKKDEKEMIRLRKNENNEENKNDQDLHQRIEGMDQHYSEEKFSSKLGKVGEKLSHKALYSALVLFEALKSPKLPNKVRMTIFGALGYLILPVDAVPDFLPAIGLVDDAGIIIAALISVYNLIDDETKHKAHRKMKDWFGEKYDAGKIDNELGGSLK
jgi:uncharacterized membrane protein YkvA (DUF1232 family)